MSVELALAVVGAADLCLKYVVLRGYLILKLIGGNIRYGKALVELYHDLKTADSSIRERMTFIEATWYRTEKQVEFVRRVAHTMSVDHCRIHIDVLETLKAKLLVAITKIGPLAESWNSKGSLASGFTKLKYAFVRESLDKTLTELEKWRDVFDPTWYLIILNKSDIIDSELREEAIMSPQTSTGASSSALATVRNIRRTIGGSSTPDTHVTLNEAGLNWETSKDIRHSTTKTVWRTRSEKLFLVDTIVCSSDLDVPRARADAERLAMKLKQVDPKTFGLLNCQGIIKRKDSATGRLVSIHLVFRLQPRDADAISLREELLRGNSFSLTTVLGLARRLAMAVSFVHTCGFVHKNIRPETILLFPAHINAKDRVYALGSAYLMGFDRFRSASFQTLRTGDASWERNLYRHPRRQGIHMHEDYVMQHDVYALGVCLLEIGLWNSFVIETGGEKQVMTPSSLFQFDLSNESFLADETLQFGYAVKDNLVRLAKERLPQRMGDLYTAAVITCLTCLDEGNEDFGNEEDMRDEDGVLIGVRFIEKVVFKLAEISF
ncbi:hypothetical protein NLG97_g4279 [Lecanicillium saksenae]|uniref:Uncharacterized protein n=1 Tax=Lecanicillium saksenae TaxID=468837 RepID=A0ACC1QWX9_9HYPO|nr:hypothetical protein NLG97_g4279 [Lecanicillium saksenae]